MATKFAREGRPDPAANVRHVREAGRLQGRGASTPWLSRRHARFLLYSSFFLVVAGSIASRLAGDRLSSGGATQRGEARIYLKDVAGEDSAWPTYLVGVEVAGEDGLELRDILPLDRHDWDRYQVGQTVSAVYTVNPAGTRLSVTAISVPDESPPEPAG